MTSTNVIPFRAPAAKRSGFRFAGKIGQMYLSNLYIFRAPPRKFEEEVAEARRQVQRIQEAIAFLAKYPSRDGKIASSVDRQHLAWWTRELARLEKERDAFITAPCHMPTATKGLY